MSKSKELHISVGLPGSGKTTKFKELSKEDRTSNHIECDAFLFGYSFNTKYKDMESLIRDRSSLFCAKTFLDGLFLSKDDIAKVLTVAEERKIGLTKVIIHYWQPNKEYCKWNDRGRREKNSSITIDNAVVDDIKDIMKLSEDFKDIEFEKKMYSTLKKEGWKVFADEHKLSTDDSGFLKGESWCLGGTWGSYTGASGTVSPSSAPEGFRELDDLLEQIAPAITFLQYKKILNNCVSIEEYTDGDYYGGTTYHNRNVLDVKALYNYLVEKELIELS